MDQNELYNAWIQSRRTPGPARGFSSRVMERIRLMEKCTVNLPVSTYGLDFLRTRFMRLTFAATLSALGLFRIGYITCTLLLP